MTASDADRAARDCAEPHHEDETPQTRRRFTPDGPLRCPECGLALHPATIQHEQALVLASCCPRCDGQLIVGARENLADSAAEPSVYLG